MKPLEQMNNVEKAKLLHQLFPDEISGFITYAENVAETMREDEALHRSQWEYPLFTFDFWLNLADTVCRKIRQYGKKLETNSGLFADQLFDGYNALFTMHCLDLYTTVRKHENEKFVKLIELFFT